MVRFTKEYIGGLLGGAGAMVGMVRHVDHLQFFQGPILFLGGILLITIGSYLAQSVQKKRDEHDGLG